MARVLVITTSFPAHEGDPSGHFVEAEARALARRGDDVEVLAPGASSLRHADGLRVTRLGGARAFRWPGVWSRLRSDPLAAFAACAWLARALRAAEARRVDRIVAHWVIPSGLPIGALAKGPLELVSHGGDVRLLLALPPLVRCALVARLLDRARAWRFVAEPLRQSLLRALPPRLDDAVLRKSFVEAPMLDLPAVDALVAERRAARERGTTQWIAVARLVPQKRVDRVISHAASESGAVELIVVGDGPERPRLERLASSLGVRARFLGTLRRRQALSWIGASDALLHASEAEGCSTVLREAEALGVPVIRLDGP